MKRGNKIYLAEYKSVREGGRVKSKFVRYLGVESDQEKVPLPKKDVVDFKPPDYSARAGDVNVLWKIAQDLDMVKAINQVCGYEKKRGNTPGKLLTLWAINRALDPESATQMDSWLYGTDLPRLSNLSKKGVDKDAFLNALDAVCSYDSTSDSFIDYTRAIDEKLYKIWRKNHPIHDGKSEMLAYDMTSIIVYGDTCPLTKKGYNAEKSRHQQINLSLLVSKQDSYPLGHQVHPGNHASMTTMQSLLPRLSDFSISEGTIIWDRGNTSQKTIETLERNGWKVICGVPKISADVKRIIKTTEVPETVEYLVPCKKKGELYATKIKAQFYEKDREVVVYRNITKAAKSVIRRNKALHEISLELNKLKKENKYSKQGDLEKEINKILHGWKSCFSVKYPEDESIVDFEWEINSEKIEEAKASDGVFVLYSTYEGYSASEVVQIYMEKDIIEKSFQCLKTVEEIKPIRHRLESRVRAYIFVCVLAYRLLAALRAMIKSSDSSKVKLSASVFLKRLSRVQRTEIDLGKNIEICHMNLTNDVKNQMAELDMKSLMVNRRVSSK